MQINIVRDLPEKVWHDFVHRHPTGNVFHTPEMYHVFRHAQRHQPELWAATKGEHVLALLLPVRITLMGGLLHTLTTRSVVYGSVLCAPGAEGEEALGELLNVYGQKMNRQALFTELRNLSDLGAVQPALQRHGYVYEDHLNYLIDLDRPPDAILQSIGRRTRKKIRRGLRKGEVAIEEVKERSQIAVCYDLLRQTYQNAQVPLADRSLFDAAFDILRPKGMIRFTLAHVEDTPVAASVELLYKDIIYGWYGAVNRDYGSYTPNELITWHIFQWGAENGYRQYDFGGAGKPDEDYGVRDFKAKFGGELVCFGRNTCVHMPRLYHVSEWGYNIYRRFLK
jgi:lipid II:glycine glycyltransferase (peptidoglycan interpeptide bridge formation enzyme)